MEKLVTENFDKLTVRRTIPKGDWNIPILPFGLRDNTTFLGKVIKYKTKNTNQISVVYDL